MNEGAFARSRHDRWVVLGVSTGINALAWGVRSSFALFYVALLNEVAWDRASAALGYSLSWLCFVVFAPVAGWLSDRWGPRTIVTAGGLVLGLALGLTAQATSLALYYVWFGFLGAAGTACMIIPSTTIVTRWFLQSRGTRWEYSARADPRVPASRYRSLCSTGNDRPKRNVRSNMARWSAHGRWIPPRTNGVFASRFAATGYGRRSP